MFATMPRKKVFKKGSFPPRRSRAKSIAGKLYEQAMENTYTSDKGRRPEYRPSAFPLCSVRVFMRLIKGVSLGYFEEERTAGGDYFTSVGTTTHETIQFQMGFSGKVWGDWKCEHIDCKKGKRSLDLYDANGRLVRPGMLTRKNTTNNVCPCCGRPMAYVEKEIRYKGLKGHIDCIILMDDGTFWVADYKTCTKNKIGKGTLPEKSHLKQLPSYCYVLKKKYRMKIAGFSLLYLSRDNPWEYYEHAERWTKKWEGRCAELVKGERRKFKAAVKSLGTGDVSYAIKHKPCRTMACYERTMASYTECPMLDVCFNENKLRKTLIAHMKEFPTDSGERKALAENIDPDGGKKR